MMFEPTDRPRLIGVPPGADFPGVIYDNIISGMAPEPPEALARVQVLVATRRMQRRLIELFQDGGARLLPRIDVITDVTHLIPGTTLATPISTLRRSLELKELVARLVDLSDSLSNTSVIDLTESLARLLDEMQSEGVELDALDTINADVSSGHWEQSLRFLQTIRTYLSALNDGVADVEARHRAAVGILCESWAERPVSTPVILAGSTGSRDTTRMLMKAVARLPQGAVVLPGFDFHLSEDLLSSLVREQAAEDHPQFRFASVMADLGLSRSDIPQWGADPDTDRNQLISLALRPASVTDQWLTEGPDLGDLEAASAGLSLMETSQPRDEAIAIAMVMRHGVERGKKVALIAPDATLARRVTAVLRRWSIIPDDSGGMPLSLSPTGRFFRHIGGLIGQPVTPVDLIALLKHPLTRPGPERGASQLATQAFEIYLRKRVVAEVTRDTCRDFAESRDDKDQDWINWLGEMLDHLKTAGTTLGEAVEQHVSLATLVCGNTEALWGGKDGEAIQNVITAIRREVDFAGSVQFIEYFQLFERALAAESVREEIGARPDVMIWGTLEARVQGADIVVLGGLNEGIWPEQPSPDPWLNRQMRRDLGLLLPERQIGLAAHDFQQAAGAPEVVFSRARRSEDSETVPSRWLNRLLNLLGGLPDNGGQVALAAMQARGNRYVDAAAKLDQSTTRVEGAPRPAPSPPVDMRPATYSVTEIQRLIRDPYAIYARKILHLRPLDPLTPAPDARIKGTVFHRILELAFAADADVSDVTMAKERLQDIAWDVLNKKVPWPSTRSFWWGQLASVSERLIEEEIIRRSKTDQIAREAEGKFDLPGTRFRIVGKADRIDRQAEGLVIYDYKTGALPTAKDLAHYDRQILIEAVMAEAGAFRDIPAETVAKVVHLDVGRTPDEKATLLEGDNQTVTIQGHLADLLTSFDKLTTGYISRRAMERLRYAGDYDHLSRFGEWDASAETTVERLT